MTVCVMALSAFASSAQAAEPSPRASWPPPAPGNVSGAIRQGTADCDNVGGVVRCQANVYTSGLMNNWARSNQVARKLNLEWKIRRSSGQILKTGAAYCQGATSSISSCERTGPTYLVVWPQATTTRICLDTIGYAYYTINTNGNTARVTASDFDCITMSFGIEGVTAP